MKRLLVGSTNAGKIREVSLALADLPDWSVEAVPELPEVEETATTFLENAKLKAARYSELTGELTVADDSGLSVHALDGRPGIHSARYAASASERNSRLLAELEALGPGADRSASFYCAFAVASGGTVIWTTLTELHGRITTTPSGEFGFGYDPVFFVPHLGKTLAEIPSGEKNRISARGIALTNLRAFLLSR